MGMKMEWITLGIAVLGVVLGVIGTCLGVLSYRRDTAQIKVFVKWDMSIQPPQQNDGSVGMLQISNSGRRPVYVSHAYVQAGKSETVLVLEETTAGYTISEGDKPIVIKVPQEGLEQFAKQWKSVCIVIEGNSGKKYVSNFPEKKPSWAN
jgi:hypothetical protein